MSLIEGYNSKIRQWSAEQDGSDYLTIDRKIQFLSHYLYYDFEPAVGPYPSFSIRLANWINNLPNDADQKLLFKLIPRLFYLGRDEFNCLHRTAFNTTLKSWYFECSNINFETDSYQDYLSKSIHETWFCPVTDSFRINQFYHLNQITSKHTFRPDWRSLRQFGDKVRVLDYLKRNGVKFLVLLEDFVGSGSQVKKTLEFACELLACPEAVELGIRILFIPMIICPKGIDTLKELKNKHNSLDFKPVVEIANSEIVNEETSQNNSNIGPYVDMIKRSFAKVKGGNPSEELKRIEEFGYKNTGGLVVMFTNTPNNSLPIIFVESDSWSPLFKRHFRD